MNYDSWVVMLNSYNKGAYGQSQSLAHEYGHVLDLCHTYLGGGCSANCDINHPDFLYDVFGNSPSTCPHIASWAADAFDINISNANKITNNLMGGNQVNRWTSGLQAAKMHRALERKSVSRYLTNNCECQKCIAFNATGNNHVSVGNDQTLSYPVTTLNEGWSWNGMEFISPINGVFQFTIMFVKDSYYYGGTTDDVKVLLIHNGNSTGSAWSGQQTGRRGTGTFTINIKLNKGDKISTRVNSDGGFQRHLATYTFSGHLICGC